MASMVQQSASANKKVRASSGALSLRFHALSAFSPSILILPSVTQDRKLRVDKLSQDFEKFNDKFKQLTAITKSKMEETPLSASAAKCVDSLACCYYCCCCCCCLYRSPRVVGQIRSQVEQSFLL